jgi:hypothetical protein
VRSNLSGHRKRGTRRPSRAAEDAWRTGCWRRGNGHPYRSACTLDIRPVRDREADCRYRRGIPLSRRAMGRHQHQYRPPDAGRVGGLADVERNLIRTRTAEGRARAKLRGKHMGRPLKLAAEQCREALARREAGEAPAENNPKLQRGSHDNHKAKSVSKRSPSESRSSPWVR